MLQTEFNRLLKRALDEGILDIVECTSKRTDYGYITMIKPSDYIIVHK